MAAELQISLAAEPLFHIGHFTVTNSLFMGTVIVLLTIVGVSLARRKKITLVPRGFYNAAEAFVEFWLDIIDQVTSSRRITLIAFPIVVSFFTYILLSNWIGLLPGVGSVGLYGEHNGHIALIPFLRAPSADLNFTLGLATLAIISTWVIGIKELGVVGHLSKFFTLKNPIFTFVGLLEFVGEFARIISFSFRLFGNVFAGEVLLAVIGFLSPMIAALPFMFLEAFVGLIQALVFSMLTLVFIKMATEGHGDHEEHHETKPTHA